MAGVTILSLGNFYIQIGIEQKILSHFDINFFLVCTIAISGVISLGSAIRNRVYKVLINSLILLAMISYVVYSYVVWVDADYTEFYSESGEERFLAIEVWRNKIYRVRGGIFLELIGEIPVSEIRHPIKNGEYTIHWQDPHTMKIITSDGDIIELPYK